MCDEGLSETMLGRYVIPFGFSFDGIIPLAIPTILRIFEIRGEMKIRIHELKLVAIFEDSNSTTYCYILLP
jgi:hypothetical protein